MARIFPSLISADLMNLQKEINLLEPYCDGFHLDIMDNHFVPNLTMGPAFINAIGTITTKPLWIHLMVTNPSTIIDALMVPAGSIITIHYENQSDKRELIKRIKNKQWLPSMAISPSTAVSDLFPYLDDLDQALIMSVEPGFSGQTLITDTLEKIEPLNAYKSTSKLQFSIAMDGGITQKNIVRLKEKGVQDFAIASALFGTNNPVKTLQELKNRIA